MVSKDEILQNIDDGLYELSERRGKSAVWSVFTNIKKEDGAILDGYVCCKKCRNLFKYNGKQTSTLIRHKCVSKTAEEMGIPEVEQSDRDGAIDACTQWVIEDCRPFSAVEGTGFAKLAQFFIDMGAKYCGKADIHDFIPDRTTISRNIEKIATAKKSEMQPILKKAVDEGLASVTTELWTDNYICRHFLCATFHYFDKDNLTSIVLGVKSMDFERLSGASIHNKIISMFSQFGIHNLETITFVTDEGTNIINALQNYTRINCSTHLFNKVVNSAFDSTNELKSLIEACQQLVKYFKRSNQQHALQTSLKADCPTRWYSFYEMFKSIADNWLLISRILAKNGQQKRFCDININIVISLVELCVYFDTISKTLQGDSYITMCYVLPSIYRMKAFCEIVHSDLPAIASFKRNILEFIESIWIKNLSIQHKVALFLYPPAKYMNEQEHNIIKQFCVDNIPGNNENGIATRSASSVSQKPPVVVSGNLLPLTTPSNRFSFFFPNLIKEEVDSENVVHEVNRYGSQHILFGTDFDAMKWWRDQNITYPRLHKFALKMLSIPASSAASERVFSLAGNLINEERNQLAPITVDNILFLNSFLK